MSPETKCCLPRSGPNSDSIDQPGISGKACRVRHLECWCNQDAQLPTAANTAARGFENIDRGAPDTRPRALWSLIESRFDRSCWRQHLTPAMFHRDCASLLAAPARCPSRQQLPASWMEDSSHVSNIKESRVVNNCSKQFDSVKCHRFLFGRLPEYIGSARSPVTLPSPRNLADPAVHIIRRASKSCILQQTQRCPLLSSPALCCMDDCAAAQS